MLIDAYIVCWNEEKLLPFTLDYYSSFCDTIHLLDNHSSDDSLKIAATYPKVKVTQWQCEDGPDVYDESSTTIIKRFAYAATSNTVKEPEPVKKGKSPFFD